MKKIAIASVLKPSNEVRIFYRLAQSIIKIDNTEIHLIGEKPHDKPTDIDRIYHHFFDNGISRYQRHIEVVKHLNKIQPELLIITAIELIPIAWITRRKHGTKIVFDVQEDYISNINNQGIYTGIRKQLLLYIVRILIKMSYRISDHFFLAEQCYTKLPFALYSHTVLQNKIVYHHNTSVLNNHNKQEKRLLFSGVISQYSGIDYCLEMYDTLRGKDPSWKLSIIGKTYDKVLAKKLKIRADQDPNILLTGIDYFVSHDQIIRAIEQSTIGIICHEYNEVSKNRIPTKLYEYCYLGLPFVTWENSNWQKTGSRLGNCLGIDFTVIQNHKINEKISGLLKNTHKSEMTDASWLSEEPKLLNSIETLLDYR